MSEEPDRNSPEESVSGESGQARRTCAAPGCGRPVWSNAPRAKWCEEHADRRNRRASQRRAEKRGEQVAGHVDEQLRIADEALSAARLAAGLQFSPDLKTAAAVAGLPAMKPSQLRKLEARARSDFGPLVEGSAEALQRLGFGALSLQLLSAIAGISQVHPGQRAGAARQLVQTMETLQVATRPTFGALSIQLVEDEDAP